GSMSRISALKRRGNPVGLGPRKVMRRAAAAALRNATGTSSARGSSPLRMISTTLSTVFDEEFDAVHERQLKEMHREVDGATAALPRARVPPLGAGRQQLEVAAGRSAVPTAAPRVLHREVGR